MSKWITAEDNVTDNFSGAGVSVIIMVEVPDGWTLTEEQVKAVCIMASERLLEEYFE